MSAPPAAPRARRFADRLYLGQEFVRRDALLCRVLMIYRPDRQVLMLDERGNKLVVEFRELRRRWREVS